MAVKRSAKIGVKSVIEQDAKFPVTKIELIKNQGWKVFDLSETEHVHANMLLNRLPNIKFAHVEEVIEALKKTNHENCSDSETISHLQEPPMF